MKRSTPTFSIEGELPAYSRVKARLREQIRAQAWAPGEQLPTQAQLCLEFGVSRITIVRALQDLEQEGLVEARQGVGTFVRPQTPTWSLTHVSQLYKQTFEPSEQPIHTIVELEIEPEPPARTGATLLGRGKTWRVVRLRLRDGQAVGYEESFIPASSVPPSRSPQALERMLLFDFMTRECGVALTSTRVSVSATTLSEVQASLLGGVLGDPALLITRITYGRDGQPATFSLNTLPADISSYYFEFHHDDPAERTE